MKHLHALKSLQSLSLHQTKVTSAGLKDVAELKSLKRLNLTGSQVTDVGLKYLSRLESLEELTLANTNITDMGVENLAGFNLKKLGLPRQAQTDIGLKHYLAALHRSPTVLILNNWQVTDAGLTSLVNLTSLRVIDLLGTQVTGAGVKKLQDALPSCNIIR